MHLGAALVLVGVILVAVALALGRAHAPAHRAAYAPDLLGLGVILIGIGVLVGNTVLIK